MPITTAVNSKANIKKSSSADIPFTPQQPVIAHYGPVTSTASQTTIALPFSVNQSLLDQFFLFVNGLKLAYGSSNDFEFISIDQNGNSSLIQLNQMLPANLNIEAYKLGLKSEVEFQTDNRFVALYEAVSQGFQGFVKTVNMAPTSLAGSPAPGTFYSTILNRAPIIDLSMDLKPRMGIDRMMSQQIFPLINESSEQGQVWGVLNDSLGLIRLVGAWYPGGTFNYADDNGVRPYTNTVNDYMEVTFYGNGLNILTLLDINARDIRVSVDGGSESSNIIPSGSYNNVLGAQNYCGNLLLPVVSGLSTGIHTVKLRNNGAQIDLFGVEILNISSSVIINPGVGYIQDKILTNSTQASLAYNAPVTGTTGGRVAIYQNSDGTIKQLFTPCATSPLYMSSANHSNEEKIRNHVWREFGASNLARTDFSILNASNGVVSAAHVLDDNTTELLGSNILTGSNTNLIAINGSTNGYIAFTFVGTGVDLILPPNALAGTTTSTINFYIDGNLVGSTSNIINVSQVYPIASGLSYGTHVLQIVDVAHIAAFCLTGFVVYQPKLPTIPSGSILLGSYNVMANYVDVGTGGVRNVSQGVLRKSGNREILYSGSGWAYVGDFINYNSGNVTQDGTAGDSFQYTFFGTGIEWGTYLQIATYDVVVSIDGSTNLSGFTTALHQTGSGATWTSSTGTIAGTVSSSGHAQLTISNLPLGLHTIVVTTVNGSTIYGDNLDIITPIHSPAFNTPFTIQNALSVGSQGIHDFRSITPVKDVLPISKAKAQAISLGGSPTTSLSYPIPLYDMSTTIKTNGGTLKISWNAAMGIASGSLLGIFTQVAVDGILVGAGTVLHPPATSNDIVSAGSVLIPVPAGEHKVDLYWWGQGQPLFSDGPYRILSVEEL